VATATRPANRKRSATSEQAARGRRFRDNADEFLPFAFGTELWSKQREVAQAVSRHKRVAVRSAHGPGKTWLAARIAIWFLSTRHPAEVITTAPTWNQVEKLLWKEVNLAWGELRIADIKQAGECMKASLRFGPGHEAYGRSTNESEKFQGIHSPHLMVIVDEASGVPDDIYDAIASLGTGGEYRELLIGNPLRPAGRFYDAFQKPQLGYHCISIPASSTPNFTGEDVSAALAAHLTSREWVEEAKATWGEDTPLYQAKVLAEFPAEDAEAVIVPLAWIEAAREREASDPLTGNLQVGVDVARFGGDSTSIAERVGTTLTSLTSYPGDTPATQVAGLAAQAARRLAHTHKGSGEVLVAVDAGGVGGGTVDILHARSDNGVRYVGVQFGGGAIDRDRFANKRAEMFWNLREYAEAGNGYPDLVVAATGAEVDRLTAQVSGMRYGYDAKGRVKIESKDSMRARGLPSPDEADAGALAFTPLEFEEQDTIGIEDVLEDWVDDEFGGWMDE